MKSFGWVGLMSLGLVSFACTGAEQQTMQTFFTAVQGGDAAAVAGISVVEFPGSVTSWEIIEVGPESKEPFGLSALYQEVHDVEAELASEKKDGEMFLEMNAAQAEEFQKRFAKNPGYEFKGELAEFQSDWNRRVKAQEGLIAKIEATQQRIADLRSAAGLSLNTQVSDKFDGEVKGKLLRLKVNDGSKEKSYTFKLQRFELSHTERNITPMARWIITEISEQGA